jgi:hypothetical protein
MIDKRRTRDGEVRYEVRLRGTDGKERSRTFRTKKEAERYERTQQTAIEQGVWIDPRSGKVTLEAWSKEWQRTVVHLRATTQRIYGANLRNHIIPELGQFELGKLTPSMLRAWLSSLTTKVGRHGKPLAPGSVAQAYRTLKSGAGGSRRRRVARPQPAARRQAPAAAIPGHAIPDPTQGRDSRRQGGRPIPRPRVGRCLHRSPGG